MANYCSKDCQTKDFKQSHKQVCKRIRTGMDMIDDPTNAQLPPPVAQRVGFEDEFAGEDFDPYCWDESIPKWEYNDASPGQTPIWTQYPPAVEASLESMLEDGFSPFYMYRPGHPDCAGKRERSMSRHPPEEVATQFVWFSDMIERDVYKGSARAIRRGGSRASQQRRL
jgi:hypothetical protein